MRLPVGWQRGVLAELPMASVFATHVRSFLFFSHVIGATLLLAPAALSAQSPTPGTYRLHLCATVCAASDSAQAIAAATIVIADDSMANSIEWKEAMTAIRARRVMRQSSPSDNVCFNVERSSTHVAAEELFFGINRNGSTRWERTRDDSLTMRVYRSPDASYELRWAGTGERITGEGWSTGWHATNTPHRNAFFVAVRIGPPASVACR